MEKVVSTESCPRYLMCFALDQYPAQITKNEEHARRAREAVLADTFFYSVGMREDPGFQLENHGRQPTKNFEPVAQIGERQ